ncbi:MAG: acyl carrier protein [Alphaproteobacteria bacterium]|nr:acyl carrier protein [Alphaproteobacteria bacterium]
MHSALNNLILTRVAAAIQTVSAPGNVQITGETRFDEDLAFDSLDLVEVAMCLEELFEIEFSRDSVLEFETVSDIVAYLSRHFFRDVVGDEPVEMPVGLARPEYTRWPVARVIEGARP